MLKVMKDLKSNKCLVSGSKAKRERRLQKAKKATKCETLSDKLQAAVDSKAKNVTKATNNLTEASKKYSEGKCGQSKKMRDRRLQKAKPKVNCKKLKDV